MFPSQTVAVTVSFLLVYLVTSEDIPKNMVVLVGKDAVLDCAGSVPFRWYRVPTSKPQSDQVIFTGTMMADNINEPYKVIKKPNKYPYERLDLLITDVQVNHSGTYRCSKKETVHCAELIVIDSDPSCQIHRMSKENDTELDTSVGLSCSINVTANAEPEMFCLSTNGGMIEASCSNRSDPDAPSAEITCTATVNAEEERTYTCIFRIKAKPVKSSDSWGHATNKPEYSFVWRSSSTDLASSDVTPGFIPLKSCEHAYSINCSDHFQLILFINVPVLGFFLIALIVIAACCVRRRRKVDKDVRYQTKTRKPALEMSPPPVYTLLTSSPYEEIPEGIYRSANPEVISSPYASVSGV